VGVERMDDYLRRPIEKYMSLPSTTRFPTEHPIDTPEVEQARKRHPYKGFEIVFRNVNFRYDEQQKWIFKNLNLVIPEGQRLGIVGRTGSGKSSLLQCLSHLYPFEGHISIGTNNPSEGG